MARSKQPSSYSESLWKMVEEAYLEGKVFEVPVQGYRDAMRLQGRYYAFRGALRRETDHLYGKPDATLTPAELRTRTICPMAQQVVCWFNRQEGEITKVSFMHNRLTPDGMAFAKALSEGKVVDPSIAEQNVAEASLKRVLEKVENLPNVDNPYFNRSDEK